MDIKEDDGQSPCCDNSDCCGSVATDGKRKKRWKTMIFTAVILSACAVAAYSLFWRAESTVTPACCPAGSTACASAGGKDSTSAGAVNDSLSGTLQQESADIPPGCAPKDTKK